MSMMSQSSLTGCPRCGHLCAGASLLPCGHLLCRKCLHFLLDSEPYKSIDCPTCHRSVRPASSPDRPRVDQFPSDVVMDRLVMEMLVERSGGRCCVPHGSAPSPPPTNLCLECGDLFCDSCSHVHQNSSASKYHCLKSLSLSDSAPMGQLSPLGPRQPGDVSTTSDNQNILQDAVEAEVRIFRQVMSTCDQMIDSIKHLLTRRENDQHVLTAYTDHLLSADVSLGDVNLQRFRHVRRECQSRAETDMKNLGQKQSRKTLEEKSTQTVIKHRGAGWERHCPELSWTPPKVALCVALPVLVSLLLGVLLLPMMTSSPEGMGLQDSSLSEHASSGHVTNEHTSSGQDTSEHTTSGQVRSEHTSSAGVNTKDIPPSPDRSGSDEDWRPATGVPYTAERVVLQTLDPSSSSLTCSLCGQHSCSSHYDDGVTDVLVTADTRVVLTMLGQDSIVVKSSSGDQTVQLGCAPLGVTQLPCGLVAVPCPLTRAVLLVSLDGSDPQIQRIQTKKRYRRIAAHPVDNTLIVGAWPDNSIDIITLQGEVVRTLVDSRPLSLNVIRSLTVVGENLLVTGGGSHQILQIHPLSDSSRPLVETLPGTFPSLPLDIAVDKAGNVFVVLKDGSVMMRTTEGDIRPLLTGRGNGERYSWCSIALQGNRLLVVTVTWPEMKSDVTECQLLDQ